MVEHDRDWPARLAAQIGERVARIRGKKMTAQALADRCSELGLPLDRTVISKLEKGLRQTLTVGELLVLAEALGVPPIELVFPLGRAESVERLPGQHIDSWKAVQRFTGESSYPGDAAAIELFRDHDRLVYEIRTAMTNASNERFVANREKGNDRERFMKSAHEWEEYTARRAADLKKHRDGMRAAGLDPVPLPPGLPVNEAAVVAAIVTSPLGVLVGRRNDGKPPWTFIAGEVEPDEQPEDAAVREVKEETGCEVRAGHVIGERVHPKTGRPMIYMAAKPVSGTKVFVGDERELAEVRWVSLDEADELMPDMFSPVREYLVSALRGGSR